VTAQVSPNSSRNSQTKKHRCARTPRCQPAADLCSS
jgi:hypothetical protein